jgi:hypothetical protein
LKILLITSCSNDKQIRLLELDWYYSSEETPVSFTALSTDRFDSLADYVSDKEGILWMKTEIDIPEYWEGDLLSVYLGRIIIADRA